MINLLLVGALLGMVLGRFFRVYVLVPASGLMIALALTDPGIFAHSFWRSCFNGLVILAAVQLGYVASLLASFLPALSLARRRSLWASHP